MSGRKSSASPWMCSCPVRMDMSMTARMGPALMTPTIPKLSSSAVFPPLIRERPAVSARTKGVVRAPVVAPEASKAMARNSSETRMARTKITP